LLELYGNSVQIRKGKGNFTYESKIISKTDLRKMQSNQAKGLHQNYL